MQEMIYHVRTEMRQSLGIKIYHFEAMGILSHLIKMTHSKTFISCPEKQI